MIKLALDLEHISKNIVQEIDCGHTKLKLRNDGLVIVVCSENHQYEVKDVKENHDAIKKLAGQNKVLVLTVAGQYSDATREARDYVSEGHHKDFVEAEAFVIISLSQRILARFYFLMNKPKLKSNYFSDVKKAEEWLLSVKKK